MSDSHKAALAKGRQEGHVVRAYLEALEWQRPRRGRPVDPDAIRARLADVVAALEAAPGPLERVCLAQKRMDLEAQVASAAPEGPDIDALAEGFVGVVASYSQRKGITFAAWRATGVPAAVLRRGGLR